MKVRNPRKKSMTDTYHTEVMLRGICELETIL